MYLAVALVVMQSGLRASHVLWLTKRLHACIAVAKLCYTQSVTHHTRLVCAQDILMTACCTSANTLAYTLVLFTSTHMNECGLVGEQGASARVAFR
jgi:hypothetical protein